MHITFPPLTEEQKTLVSEAPMLPGNVASESEEGKDLLIEAETTDIFIFWESAVRNHIEFALTSAKRSIALSIPTEVAAKQRMAGGRMKRASILNRNARSGSSG